MTALLELQRLNGTESYEVEAAHCNAYPRDGATEVVFVLKCAKAIATLPDTAELQARPRLEIGFVTPKLISEALGAGAEYNGIPAFDDSLDEWMTNLYYCEHEGVDGVGVIIEAADAESVTATIEGMTVDVNYYDGSKPAAKVLVRAVFQKKPDLKKSLS
jgi:hypothetical protein